VRTFRQLLRKQRRERAEWMQAEIAASVPSGEIKPLREAEKEFRRQYLVSVLEATGGVGHKAAALAGLSRTGFYNLAHKAGLRLREPPRQNRGNDAWRSLSP
jgi:DNA-binding NtrC family response regulator